MDIRKKKIPFLLYKFPAIQDKRSTVESFFHFVHFGSSAPIRQLASLFSFMYHKSRCLCRFSDIQVMEMSTLAQGNLTLDTSSQQNCFFFLQGLSLLKLN